MNSSIVPVLYQPSSVEIMSVAASAAHRHPELAARLDKAAELLSASALQLDATAWERCQLARFRIASQSHAGAYIVCGLSCPCEDCRRNRVAYCKHAIAVSLYTKILTNRFNADVRQRILDLGVEDAVHLHAYAKRMGYVQVKRAGSAYIFSDAASAVRYSLWLAAQQPIAVNWPVAQSALAA